MTSKKKALFIALSFILAIVITFKSHFFSVFVIQTPVLTLLIYTIFQQFREAINFFRFGNIKRAFTMILSALCVIIIIPFAYWFFYPKIISILETPKPYFKTNIFTNECMYVKSASDTSADHWYYKNGCTISDAEKERIKNEAK